MTAAPRKPLRTANQRYWASMASIVVVTIIVAGLLAGTVSMLTGARAGRSSVWGGIVVALVMLAGWTLGTRVRDRKKLDLPLWRRLDEEQTVTLNQYRQWSRTGRIEDTTANGSSMSGKNGRARKAGRGRSAKAPPKTRPQSTASKRDRIRAADVRRRRQDRENRPPS